MEAVGGSAIPRAVVLARLCDALELSGRERDQVYFAAGRCPPCLTAIGHWEPTIGLVARVFATEALSDDDRAEFRQVLGVLVDRWHRSASRR
jgi:hypothetical protein